MNVSSSCFTGLRRLLLGLVGFASCASAFPPAPTFTLHGIVRDSFGWALRATDSATVVIKQNGVVIAQAPIDETVRSGENFRIQLPMDVNAGDPYKTGAQTTGSLLTIEVKFPTQTMLVTSLRGDQRVVGQPAAKQFIDFTVGLDSDGDGIPDDWEWWQLTEMGIGAGDPRWSLNTLGIGDYDHDGTTDYIEYLAGTFAFLNNDKLDLKITGFAEDGSAQLVALNVYDKTYRIEASNDLKTWVRVMVRRDSHTAPLEEQWTAAETREVTFESPVPSGNTMVFYRLILVR